MLKICTMNKLITILLAIFVLQACNSNNKKETNEPNTGHEHKSNTTVLSLNEGQKWKSDPATRENVGRLQMMSRQFANHELAEYKALGATLQEGLNKMTRECRMKGKDHDALHQWLEPFAKSVADLNKATEVSQARKIFQDIHGSLEMYPKYFE